MKEFCFSDDLIKHLKAQGVTWDEPAELLSSALHAFRFSRHLISPNKKILSRELQSRYLKIAKLANQLHIAASGLPELEKAHAGFNWWDWLLRPVRDQLYSIVDGRATAKFDINALLDGRDLATAAKGLGEVATSRAKNLCYDGVAPTEGYYDEFILQFCLHYASRPCHGMTYEAAKVEARKTYAKNKRLMLTVAASVLQFELGTGRDMEETLKKTFDEKYQLGKTMVCGRYRDP